MTTKVNERALVLEMLLAVNEEGQYSHLVLRGKFESTIKSVGASGLAADMALSFLLALYSLLF